MAQVVEKGIAEIGEGTLESGKGKFCGLRGT